MSERDFTVECFYNSLSVGNLRGTRCKECGAHLIPPRPVCLRCRSSNLEWFESSGEGILETFTVIHVAPTSHVDKVPYIVGVVRVKEGPTVTGRILDVDPNNPEKIKIGMRVKVTPLKEIGRVVLAFKPI